MIVRLKGDGSLNSIQYPIMARLTQEASGCFRVLMVKPCAGCMAHRSDSSSGRPHHPGDKGRQSGKVGIWRWVLDLPV